MTLHRTDQRQATSDSVRPGGLWEALATAIRENEDDPREARRRLAALRLRHATASLADFEPCA